MSELREQDRLAALVESGMALAAEHDLDTLLSRIAELARQVVGATYAAVGVVGKAANLEQFVHSGIDAATVEAIGDLPTGRGVLGAMLEERIPLRLPEISAHPRSAGFPPHHPVMRSFLGAPIVVRGRVYGRLYLTDKQGADRFSDEDERLVMMFAAQAGVAIENAALYEQVRARGEELAQRLAQIASVDRVGRLLISETPTDQVLVTAAEEARSLMRGASATVMLLDEATDEAIVRQAVGGARAAALVGVRMAPGSSKSQAVIRRRRPELIVDLAGDPEVNVDIFTALGRPRNGAFAPLLVRNRAIGAIAVYERAGGDRFTEDDLLLLQMLANQVAVGLENDRLTGLLRELAVLEERERISKELHDGVIQAIYSVGLSLQGSLSLLERDRERAAGRIQEAIVDLDNVVRDVRNYIFELRPKLVQDRGLEAAVRELARELQVNTVADVTIDVLDDACELLDRRQESHLIQIVREVLSNIARHAHPGEVRITCAADAGWFTLAIEDDGVGFDPEGVVRGQGLTNMEERAAELGGALDITAREEGGTRHTIRIPLG